MGQNTASLLSTVELLSSAGEISTLDRGFTIVVIDSPSYTEGTIAYIDEEVDEVSAPTG